mgnify:CR=1 FL=1
MLVRVVRSFADRRFGSYSAGEEVQLPDGADWLEAGFVEPVEDEAEEVDVSQYHTSQGWYDVPGLDKKVREDEAITHLRGETG